MGPHISLKVLLFCISICIVFSLSGFNKNIKSVAHNWNNQNGRSGILVKHDELKTNQLCGKF